MSKFRSMTTFQRRALLILIFSHILIYFAKHWFRDFWGDDFTAYYQTAAGSFDPSAWYASRMWYPEWAVKVLFWPFTLFGMEAAWRIMYCLNVASWIALVRKLPGNLWGELAYIVSFHPMSILLGFNNVQPVLIYMATFPLGAVVAGILKPYYFGFAILHAIGIGMALYQRQARGISNRATPSWTPRLSPQGPDVITPLAHSHHSQVVEY